MMKRDWREIARTATAVVDAARLGERQETLANAAAASGVKPQTLRTYVLAARFEASLPQELRAATRYMPAIALEAAARWYARDPMTAGKAMESYAQAGFDVVEFIKAERAARPSEEKGLRRAGRRKSDYRRHLLTRLAFLERLWPQPSPRAFSIAPFVDEKASDPSGLADLMLRLGPHPPIAACIVGPYADAPVYRARAGEWALRVLGLTHFHREAALILPVEAEAARYVGMLERAKGAEGVLLLRDPGRSP